MFVVAQGALPNVALDPQLFWRTEDGGRTWSKPLLTGYIDNTPDRRSHRRARSPRGTRRSDNSQGVS